MITRPRRELAGERDPTLQQLRRLRIGDHRCEVFRPQREIAPRQLVGIAHARDYNRSGRNRCIVVAQHLH
jgi:hypothetical protein